MATYVEVPPRPATFDPAAVVASCIESGVHALLVDHGAYPPAFFDLSSGVAGELVHRLSTYGIRMAGVVPDPTVHSAHFQDFAREANRGKLFRFFENREEAIRWLEQE